MAGREISELAERLGEHAEAVCRRYLSNGRREGRYWRVGDVFNTAGGSLYVRLIGQAKGKGRRGKWVDYVALRVMLRRCFGWRLRARPACFAQHNSGLSRRVA